MGVLHEHGGDVRDFLPRAVKQQLGENNDQAAALKHAVFQVGLKLQPTPGTVNVSAYSSTGHDMSVYVQKDDEPFTGYGLARAQFDWSNPGRRTRGSDDHGDHQDVTDGMVRFWFAPFATAEISTR